MGGSKAVGLLLLAVTITTAQKLFFKPYKQLNTEINNSEQVKTFLLV